MKTCPICDAQIKNRMIVDGKVVNTQRRKYCLDCSPFGSANNKQLKCEQIAEESSQRKRKKNKDQYRLYQKRMRIERKKALVELCGGKCTKCGYSKCLRALEFHHLDKDNKTFNLSSLGYTCSWDRLVKEVKKCTLLCATCHRETEAEADEWL